MAWTFLVQQPQGWPVSFLSIQKQGGPETVVRALAQRRGKADSNACLPYPVDADLRFLFSVNAGFLNDCAPLIDFRFQMRAKRFRGRPVLGNRVGAEF